jgi:hypothetical protein
MPLLIARAGSVADDPALISWSGSKAGTCIAALRRAANASQLYFPQVGDCRPLLPTQQSGHDVAQHVVSRGRYFFCGRAGAASGETDEFSSLTTTPVLGFHHC